MTAYELDHLAIATRTWEAPGAVLIERLGAQYAHGMQMPLFSPCQFALGSDMRIELLEPEDNRESFIYRFLEQNEWRSKPHHITFKVSDIEQTIAKAKSLGVEPILIRIGHEVWREAFLHPRDTGLGILVQFVETSGPLPTNGPGFVESMWAEPTKPPVDLPYLMGTVAAWEKPMLILREVLGAEVSDLADGIRAFRWDEGAEIILSLTSDVPAGINAVGVSQPGNPDYDALRYLGLVDDAPVVPELGIRVIDLNKAPAPAA